MKTLILRRGNVEVRSNSPKLVAALDALTTGNRMHHGDPSRDDDRIPAIRLLTAAHGLLHDAEDLAKIATGANERLRPALVKGAKASVKAIVAEAYACLHALDSMMDDPEMFAPMDVRRAKPRRTKTAKARSKKAAKP